MDIMDEVFAEEDQRERIMASELAALRDERDALREALREFLDFSERNDLPMILNCMTEYGLAACLRDSVHKNARAALAANTGTEA